MDVYNAGFELLTLEHVSPRAGGECVRALVSALVTIDILYLREHPLTPPLIRSGVRYRRQKLGADRWIDIPRMLETKEGSCEDLVAWRCAELALVGETATPAVLIQDMGMLPTGQPFVLYHVVTRRASGQLEDIAQAHGMDHVPFRF